MKALVSKPAPIPVKREPKGAANVVIEPFDIPEVDEFRPLNNTRKVHYPMMLAKYQIKQQKEVYDDFRMAMYDIVNMDNDELFSENLTKKLGRASV